MKARFVLLGAAVLVAAISGFALWRVHASLDAAHARTEAAEARRVRARVVMHDASERLRAAREATAALGVATVTTDPKTAGGTGKPAGMPRDWNAEAKWFEAQLKDPKVQLSRLAVAKMRLREKFAPIYRKLALTPDKIAAFEDAEAAWEEKNQDIYSAAVAQHIDNDDPAVKALYGQAARERTAAEKSLLGRNGYAELADYRRTVPIQEFVAGFDGLATVSGDPLSDAQKQQLIAVIGQAIPNFGNDKKATANIQDVDWSHVDVAAAGILSPAQLALFQTQDPPTHSAGGGGRFWAALDKALAAARKFDASSGAPTTANPPP